MPAEPSGTSAVRDAGRSVVGAAASNAQAIEQLGQSTGRGTEMKDPQDVVLYLTLNNTTHKGTEIPEALSALQMAEKQGMGHKELLPISDPYWTGSGAYDASLGGYENVKFHDESDKYSMGQEAADRVTWWHGQSDMTDGQVKIGGEILNLGRAGMTDSEDPKQIQAIVTNWSKLLTTLGMPVAYQTKVLAALFMDAEGKARMIQSGDGATNELVQFIMAMYRAEIGEITVTDVVFSGHHYYGNDSLFGETPGMKSAEHAYDADSDAFSLLDVAALRQAFPKAYAGVKSAQLAACNTHELGISDMDLAQGTDVWDNNEQGLSTPEFLQGIFPNVGLGAYWSDLAPTAASGAETNGEFLLDASRQQSGNQNAAKDARHTFGGKMERATLDNGKLQESKVTYNSGSYGGAAKKGLRNKNTAFDKRDDLQKHVYESDSLDAGKDTDQKAVLWQLHQEQMRRRSGRG